MAQQMAIDRRATNCTKHRLNIWIEIGVPKTKKNVKKIAQNDMLESSTSAKILERNEKKKPETGKKNLCLMNWFQCVSFTTTSINTQSFAFVNLLLLISAATTSNKIAKCFSGFLSRQSINKLNRVRIRSWSVYLSKSMWKHLADKWM